MRLEKDQEVKESTADHKSKELEAGMSQAGRQREMAEFDQAGEREKGGLL